MSGDETEFSAENLAAAEDALHKPMRDFIQLDGFIAPGDSTSDVDGDGIFGGRTREPQHSGATVLVFVADDANHDDVVRILRKQLDWIERDGFDDFRRILDVPLDCEDNVDNVIEFPRAPG